LAVQAQPDNDQFAERTWLFGERPRALGSTLAATREPGETGSTGAAATQVSAWWSWTAPKDGVVRVVVWGEAGFPVATVRVSRGPAIAGLSPVAGAVVELSRGTFFLAQAGSRYELAVVAPEEVPVFFTLELDYVPEPTCFPSQLNGNFGDLRGTTVGAVPAPELSAASAAQPTVFWDWTAPGTGTLWVSLLGERNGLSVTVYRQQTDSQYVHAAGGATFPDARLPTEPGARYRFAFSSEPGQERAFQFYYTWSSLRLATLQDGLILPGATPLDLEVADLPGDVSFGSLGLFVSDEPPISHSPPDLRFVWQPLEGGPHTLTPHAVDLAGRQWWGAPVRIGIRPPNDDFAHAQAVAGTPLTLRAVTSYATREAGEPAGNNSVWFRWTAPANGQGAFVAAYSGLPAGSASVAVYRGESLGSLVLLGSAPANSAEVLLPVTAGEVYVVRLAGPTLVPAVATLLIEAGPGLGNDRFADRLVLSGARADIAYPVWFATVEPGERGPFNGTAYRTAWYSWTAPVNGELRLEATVTDGGEVAPQVWFGTNLATLAPRWSPTQLGTTTAFNRLLVPVSAGTSYQVQVNSRPGNPGAASPVARLHLESTPAPANDEFSSPTVLANENLVIRGTLAAARGESEGPTLVRASTAYPPVGHRAVWYRWQAPRTTRMTLALVSPTDVQVQVFRGTNLATLTSVAGPVATGNAVEFPVTANSTYTLAFVSPDRLAGVEFLARLVLAGAPPNDNFANRERLAGAQTVFVANHDRATSETGDPGTFSVWWTWTAPANGWATLRTMRGILGYVYTGTALGQLTAQPLETYEAPLSDRAFVNTMGFTCQAGTEYQLALRRPQGTSGAAFYPVILDTTSLGFTEPAPFATVPEGEPVTLRLGPIDTALDGELTCPLALHRTGNNNDPPLAWGTNLPPGFTITPAGDALRVAALATNQAGEPRLSRPLLLWVRATNDAFAGATEAPRTSPQTFQLRVASRETGEPISTAGPTAVSRWWRWTAPLSGDLEWPLYPFLDFVATLYQGSALGTLTVVPGQTMTVGSVSPTLRARVRRGETYHLAVTGPAEAGGTLGAPTVVPLRFTDFQAGFERFVDEVEFGIELLAPLAEVERVELLLNLAPVFTSYASPFHLRLPEFAKADSDYVSARVWFRDLPSPWDSPAAEVLWRPRNDVFAWREHVHGDALDLVARLAHAGRELGESDHGFSEPSRTVWWTWLAPADGVLAVTSQNGFELALYTGDALSQLTSVASATGHLRADVVGGREYQLVVAAGLAATSDQVAMRFAPTGLSPNQGAVFGELVWLATHFGRSSAEPSDPQQRVWRWTAPASGALALGWDARLTELTCQVRDLASGGQPPLETLMAAEALASSGFQRLCAVQAGHEYELEFGVGAGLVTPFTAQLRYLWVIENDAFANPALLAGANMAVATRFADATLEPGEPATRLGWTTDIAGSVWLAWTAPTSGLVRVAASAGLELAVVTGDSLDTLTSVATGGDGGLTFQAETGHVYRMAVSALKATVPYGVLTVTLTPSPSAPPPNDLFRARLLLAGEAPRFLADTTSATREHGEPIHAGVYGGRSVWWSWQAPASGSVRVTSLPVGGAPHQIAVYQGNALEALMPVAAQALAGPGEFRFDAAAGETYAFAVDGRHGAELQTDIAFAAAEDLPPRFLAIEAVVTGGVRLRFRGPAGATFRLEGSADLGAWTEVTQSVFLPGDTLLELPMPNAAVQFYRLSARPKGVSPYY
jgi:hypothetical protein